MKLLKNFLLLLKLFICLLCSPSFYEPQNYLGCSHFCHSILNKPAHYFFRTLLPLNLFENAETLHILLLQLLTCLLFWQLWCFYHLYRSLLMFFYRLRWILFRRYIRVHSTNIWNGDVDALIVEGVAHLRLTVSKRGLTLSHKLLR